MSPLTRPVQDLNWLITNFVDPEAEFIFVPPDEIPAVVEAQGAIPYDASGVELGHHANAPRTRVGHHFAHLILGVELP